MKTDTTTAVQCSACHDLGDPCLACFGGLTTTLGPISRLGRWTISLMILEAGRTHLAHSAARAAAFRVAADLCDVFASDGFDVRMLEEPGRIAVSVEVAVADDFARVVEAMTIAAVSAAARGGR